LQLLVPVIPVISLARWFLENSPTSEFWTADFEFRISLRVKGFLTPLPIQLQNHKETILKKKPENPKIIQKTFYHTEIYLNRKNQKNNLKITDYKKILKMVIIQTEYDSQFKFQTDWKFWFLITALRPWKRKWKVLSEQEKRRKVSPIFVFILVLKTIDLNSLNIFGFWLSACGQSGIHAALG
jgi:hypothetical protein